MHFFFLRNWFPRLFSIIIKFSLYFLSSHLPCLKIFKPEPKCKGKGEKASKQKGKSRLHSEENSLRKKKWETRGNENRI